MSHSLRTRIPPVGQELTDRDVQGNIVIKSRIGPSLGQRRGYEKLLPGCIKVGLSNMQRSHSQGPGTGYESRNGIVYAPVQVNQSLQRLGVEKFIIELQEAVNNDDFKRRYILPGDEITLLLTTTTITHREFANGKMANTFRLKEIEYVVQAHSKLKQIFTVLFEASIEVSNDINNPRISTHVEEEVSLKIINSDLFLYGR